MMAGSNPVQASHFLQVVLSATSKLPTFNTDTEFINTFYQQFVFSTRDNPLGWRKLEQFLRRRNDAAMVLRVTPLFGT